MATTSNLAADARLKSMYGKLPSRSHLLNKKLQDRKYFDSGDYALSKAACNGHALASSTLSTSPSLQQQASSNYTTIPTSSSAATSAPVPTPTTPAFYVGSRHPDPNAIPHNFERRGSTVTCSPPRRSSIITASEA